MEIRRGEVLGIGTYGIVYAAECVEKGKSTSVAIKRMLKEKDSPGCSNLIEFASLFRSQGHPFIVEALMGVDSLGTSTTRKGKQRKVSNKELTPLRKHGYEDMFEDNMFHLIFERAVCDGAMLASKNSPFDLTLKQRVRLMHHVLCALEWMHEHSMLHRDIKVENFLVFGDDPDKLVMKIADLGMVRYHVRMLPTSPNAYTTKDRPPEVALRCDQYDRPADTWAAGVSFFRILTKECLFDPGDDADDGEILHEILLRHEDLFKNINDFKHLYAHYGMRFEDNLKLPYKKPMSYGSLSNNLIRGNKYVNIEDRLLDIYIEKGESFALIRRVAAFLRDCLVLDPALRPSPTKLLDRYADLFLECDPNASEERRRSRAFENENSDIHWRGNVTVDVELKPKSSEELKSIVEHALHCIKRPVSYICRDPRIVLHAIETYERFLAWRDYTDECEKKSSEDLAMLQVFNLKPWLIFYYLCYMHYKQFVPLEYLEIGEYFECLIEEIGDSYKETYGEELTYSKEALFELERFVISNFYSYGVFVPTMFEGADQWFMGSRIPYDPWELIVFLLEHYFELNGSPENLIPLLGTYTP